MSVKRNVILGLSGGVDSSVSAYLLKNAGYDVDGVFMVNWTRGGACDWEKDLFDARRAAKYLNIPLRIWNFEKEYQEKVWKDFLREYQKGGTPSPDVFCNKYIKFGSFFERAMRKEKTDFIATGHYARIQKLQMTNDKSQIKSKIQNPKSKSEAYRLLRATDTTKDQTYFLYQLKQKQLARTLFPVGGMLKSDVKKLAQNVGLFNWNRAESMGICFIGEQKMDGFLDEFLKPRHGTIVDLRGKVLGGHSGVWHFTLGQRKGIGIGGGKPYFVVRKDAKKNVIVVAQEPEAGRLLSVKGVLLSKANFIRPSVLSLRAPIPTSEVAGRGCGDPLGNGKVVPVAPLPRNDVFFIPVLYRDRHLAPLQRGSLLYHNGRYQITFAKSKRAVTPGQSLVVYDVKGEECLGGGVIEKVHFRYSNFKI